MLHTANARNLRWVFFSLIFYEIQCSPPEEKIKHDPFDTLEMRLKREKMKNPKFEQQEDTIETFLEHEKFIDPEIMEKAPKVLLNVTYGTKKMYLGTEYDVQDVAKPPTHVSWPYEEDEYYTFMVIGTDIPNREKPKSRCFQHCFIGNIPKNNFTIGTNVTEYVGIIGANFDPGNHRMLFLVYKQSGYLIHYDEAPMKRWYVGFMRAMFNPFKLATKYGLGNPYAVNYCTVHQPLPVKVDPIQV